MTATIGTSLPGDAVIEAVPVRSEGELFDRAVRRIEVMAGLDHPHLVPLLDAGVSDGLVYAVTPLPSSTADSTEIGPMGLAAAPVLRDVALGLRHLHRRGALHRDVQTRHVGWYGGTVRLGGLALCDVTGDASTCGTGPIGALLTMAPSIVLGRRATAGADVYGLGASLHLLATGVAVHPAVPETVPRRLRRMATEEPTVDPSLPDELRPIVSAALAADGDPDPSALDHALTELDALVRSSPTNSSDTPV
ncbi:MAG: protein kinase [Actinomycetota bacterium]